MTNATRASKPPVTKRARVLQPLSAFPRDVAVRNMVVWVDRTTEIRQNENPKRDGRVPRPLNAFMLYRLAHLQRAHRLYLEGAGLSISQIVSNSWKRLEQPEVREQYRAYAAIEKRNHLHAHPGYKFCPRRKPQRCAGDEEEPGYAAGEEDSYRIKEPTPRLKDVWTRNDFVEVLDSGDGSPDLRFASYYTSAMHMSFQNCTQGWPAAVTSLDYQMRSEEVLLARQNITGSWSEISEVSEDRTNDFSGTVYASYQNIGKLCAAPQFENPETWTSHYDWARDDAIGIDTALGTSFIE